MYKQKPIFLIGFYCVTISLMLFSCQQKIPAPPLPKWDMEYLPPIEKKITFPKKDTINWDSIPTIKLAPLPTKKLDLESIPSKPFVIDDITNIEGQIESEHLDLNELPSASFNLDSLPTFTFELETITLGEPDILEAGPLANISGTSRGIQTGGQAFGLNGSPNNIIKDNNGFLWIGTQIGIARYDSHKFEFYGTDQGLDLSQSFCQFMDSKERIWIQYQNGLWVIDPSQKLASKIISDLPLNAGYSFDEDKQGNIWYPDIEKGYHIINLERKTIKNITPKEGLLESTPPIYISPLIDNEGYIWLSSFNGVNILDLKKGKNKSLVFEKEKDSSRNQIVSIEEDSKGNIWLGGLDGAAFIDKKNATYNRLPLGKFITNYAGTTSIYEDKHKNIWLGTDLGSILKYDQSKQTIEKFNLNNSRKNKFISPLKEDYQGNIWTTTKFQDETLYKININEGRAGNFTSEDGLSNDSIWSNIMLNDKSIWIGSTGGIDIYNPNTKSIKKLGVKNNLLQKRNPYMYKDSQNRIWSTAVNPAGVTIIDPQKQYIQYLTKDQGLAGAYRSKIEDKNSNYWLGGIDGNITFLNKELTETKTIQLDTVGSGTIIYSLSKDANNNIWASTSGNGIYRIDPKHQTIEHFTSENGFLTDNLNFIHITISNQLWISSDRGVYLFNPNDGSIKIFQKEQGLISNDVYDIITHNSKVYLGTLRGINILEIIDREDSLNEQWQVTTIAEEQGLQFLDVALGSSMIDDKGRLWIGIENEILSIIDDIKPDTTALKAYISGINLYDTPINFKTALLSIDSEKQGLKTPLDHSNYLNSNGTSSTLDPNVEYNDIEGPYNLPLELQLPHNQNYISFNFNALAYSNPNSVVYRYFLEGIDKNWSNIISEAKSENYRDLPPGDYTFKVIAKGYNNVWSKPVELSFSIIPPWWKTWWAYLAYVTLFALILYSISNYRSQWLKKENRILEERVKHRTSQLEKSLHDLEATQTQLIQSEKMASLGELTAGIAHEIQNPLNFVNNFSEINTELIEELQAERQKPESERDLELEEELMRDIAANEEKIRHHGTRADAIVKGMLQHSRNSSSDKELTDINKLADEYMRLSYHGLRARDKSFVAGMQMDLDDSIPKIMVAPQDIGRVLLNLINNAFYAVNEKKKTAPADYKPMVTVATKQVGDQIEINIIDNGHGIPAEVVDKIFQPFFTTKPSGQGTGLGLSLSYDIIKTHGGTLTVKTSEGKPININNVSEKDLDKGTMFTILLPINNEDTNQK